MAEVAKTDAIPEEDLLRADLYDFLAALLAFPPEKSLLKQAADLGGDETEWKRFANPNVLLDNLIADGKAVPMIVVMPNGRAQKNDRAEGNVFATAPAFADEALWAVLTAKLKKLMAKDAAERLEDEQLAQEWKVKRTKWDHRIQIN